MNDKYVILLGANEDTGDLFVSGWLWKCIKHNVLCVILLVANEDKGDLFVSGWLWKLFWAGDFFTCVWNSINVADHKPF